jgi:hypothetical protein
MKAHKPLPRLPELAETKMAYALSDRLWPFSILGIVTVIQYRDHRI